ncbi:MAG: hypothetical protein ACXV3F_00295 [Frankiaceae bacterium]
MAAQWPHVKAWLAATIPTLSGLSDVQVFTGPPVSGEDPDRYVTIGYVTDDKGGTYQQVQSDDGFVWQETGEIHSQIVAQSGDEDESIAEGGAFAIADAIDAAIRNDRRLGNTLSPDSTVESVVEVLSVSNAAGTATALVHTLRYITTT